MTSRAAPRAAPLRAAIPKPPTEASAPQVLARKTEARLRRIRSLGQGFRQSPPSHPAKAPTFWAHPMGQLSSRSTYWTHASNPNQQAGSMQFPAPADEDSKPSPPPE